MKDAKTEHDLKGQVRCSNVGLNYKILSFSTTCFVNHQTTWLIEYEESGNRFYRPEVAILKDKIVKMRKI